MNKDEPLQVRVVASPWGISYEFQIRQGNHFAVNLTMDEIAPGCISEPTFHLNEREAQVLMNDLWHAGLRPSTGEGSTGEIQAIKGHLADMRSIAFNRLKIGLDK